MPYVHSYERGGATVIALDRPPMNAMNIQFLAELLDALETVASDRPASVVLAGREGCFSAGVDLKAWPGYGPDERRRMVTSINRMVIATYGLTCPVVAAITGHAVAGGFVLALCTDYRVASHTGSYGLTEIKVGVPYPRAALGVARHELGPQASRVLVLGSNLTDAANCARLGAFDEVIAPDAVVDRALEVASGLGEMPDDVYARTKSALRAEVLAEMRGSITGDPLLDA